MGGRIMRTLLLATVSILVAVQHADGQMSINISLSGNIGQLQDAVRHEVHFPQAGDDDCDRRPEPGTVAWLLIEHLVPRPGVTLDSHWSFAIDSNGMPNGTFTVWYGSEPGGPIAARGRFVYSSATDFLRFDLYGPVELSDAEGRWSRLALDQIDGIKVRAEVTPAAP
jgi:hypothetical protein